MSRFLCLLAVATAALTVSAADDTYEVEFEVQLTSKTRGTFVMEVHPEWAPLGAARFKELVDTDFFKGVRFFRVIGGFMAQFGIHGNPKISATWKDNKLTDDPVVESNKAYYVSFATSGKDSRTTQMFINFSDNANLDGMGFSPFAKVTKGMETVDAIEKKHGETPDQGRIQAEGNKYLKTKFPNLSFIRSAKVVAAGAKDEL